MTLITDTEFLVSGALQNTIGNDLLMGLIVLFLIVVGFIMIGLSFEAAIVLFVPMALTVLLVAGVGTAALMIVGLVGGIVIYLAFTKMVNR